MGVKMVTRSQIIALAEELGFEDVGFTTVEPFEDHKQFLLNRQKEYGWAEKFGLNLIEGTDPRTTLEGAKSIIVLMEVYFKGAFPKYLEGHFGRCYLDDDRVTRDGLAKRIKAFRGFLRDNGINSAIPFNIPHRMTATRAGMGTFGKNCLFYSNKAARQSSWVLPITVVVDAEFEPGKPTTGNGCPDWCRNACVAACPTRALKNGTRIDPQQCVSYMSYYGRELTPVELREPMGMYVYGCDRCQNVCPRNQPWLSKDLPMNEKAVLKAKDFELPKLLHMDKTYFEEKIWPHMFYMSHKYIWRWKMNVARVMGNSRDKAYLPDLAKVYKENEDERVRAMVVWAVAKIGGHDTAMALEGVSQDESDLVKEEINRIKAE